MADFYVSQVRYNSDNSHVAALRVHEVASDGSFSSTTYKDMTRPDVIKLVKTGKVFMTIVKTDGKWKQGSPLQVLEVSTEYLKTKNDKTTKDNLESLPVF